MDFTTAAIELIGRLDGLQSFPNSGNNSHNTDCGLHFSNINEG
jgi:hypothetical protein